MIPEIGSDVTETPVSRTTEGISASPSETSTAGNSKPFRALVRSTGLFLGALVAYSVMRQAVPENPSSEGGLSGKFRTWATAVDESQCLQVSKDIYARRGTVADATVATLLCLGVTLPQSLGMGGGFYAVYFNKKTGEAKYLDSRETAPAASTRDMFVGPDINSRFGPLSIGIPAELKGYKELLNTVGSNLQIEELFKPAITIARNGFKAGLHLTEAIRVKREIVYADPGLRKVYFNTRTNNTWMVGETIYNFDLADSLERLSKAPDFVHEFYKGSMAREIVEEVKRRGGILTMADLSSNKPLWGKPSHCKIQNIYDVYSPEALPGSGPILTFMLNTLEAYNITRFKDDSQTYQRLAEIFKFGYAKRSLLADPRFSNVKEIAARLESRDVANAIREKINDKQTLPLEEYGGAVSEAKTQGTSHANFFGPNGDVISITSSTNLYFGSGVQVGGIILNNQMDDFSTPGERNSFGLMPSEANFIKPGKRPMSSMAPAIIVKDGEAVMAIGAAGGSQITTAVMQVILHYFYRGATLVDSIKHRRIHHQYTPNFILYEDNFDSRIIADLREFGHQTQMKPMVLRGSVVVAIAREGEHIIASVDARKGGGVLGG